MAIPTGRGDCYWWVVLRPMHFVRCPRHDCVWFLVVCWCNNNITFCTGGGTTQPAKSSRAHHLCTMHPVDGLTQVSLFPAPSATHPGAALGRLGVRVTNQPIRCWARCSSAVRGLPRGQVCLAPWVAQGSLSVTMVSRMCSVTMVILVACTPLALVAI